MSDFQLRSFVHEFDCPNCLQRTKHTSATNTILFANIQCEHCGQRLVIVQDKLWVGDQDMKGQQALKSSRNLSSE